MRKKTYLSILIIFIVLLSSCDLYEIKPNNFINTKWVSVDPDIFFIVEKEYYWCEDEKKLFDSEEEYYDYIINNYGIKCVGELRVNNEAIKIEIGFDYRTGAEIVELALEDDEFADDNSMTALTVDDLIRRREWYVPETNILLRGQCKFKDGSFVLRIDKEYIGKIFNESVKRITFYREDIAG